VILDFLVSKISNEDRICRLLGECLDENGRLTFTFDNEIGNEENAEDEGDGVTVENDDNNADDNGNDNNDDGNEDDGSTLTPANDEVYRD
jgi:hypothetical protein